MTALSLEQAPPLSVPTRFFVTAPLFGAAAGILLALRAETILGSRWAPETLAVVHLLALGFMLQVMLGALLQFLPVAVGVNVWRPGWLAGATHPALAAGTLCLVFGFLLGSTFALRLAVVVLGLTLLGYLAAVAIGLVRSPAIGPTLLSLRFAVLGLGIAAGLGLTLAGGMGWGWPLPFAALTAVHAAWGLLGWGLVLVVGVALLVVPMFQLTPPYPVALARAVPLTLFAALVLWSVGKLSELAAVGYAGATLGAGAMVLFAVLTLKLQAQRKRRIFDTTFWSWRLGMVCLLAGAALGLALTFEQPAQLRPRLEYLLGVLLLGGAFPALIGGMLYKIIPFLCWLHLQRVMRSPPNMHQVLAEKSARWQFRIFLAALACLLGGAAWSPLVIAGGALLALSCLALELNLVRALAFYRRTRAAAVAAAPPVASALPSTGDAEHAR